MLPKTRILLIRSISMGIHLCNAVPDLYPQIRGGGGGMGGLPKTQFGLKIRRGRAPPLDRLLFWYNKSYCTCARG